MYSFENMNAWQEARKLVVEVYQLLSVLSVISVRQKNY